MFLQEGRKVTKKEIAAYLKQHYWKKAVKLSKRPHCARNPAYYIEQTAEALYELNGHLMHGDEIYAVCTSYPRNLDAGKHYYQLRFPIKCSRTNADGKKITTLGIGRLWAPLLMDIDRKGEYCWSSGAIGMSRVMDATDAPFAILRNLGGCYAQVDCL